MDRFQIMTKVVSGIGALQVLQEYKKERILIICDTFLRQSGILESVLCELHDSNRFSIYDGVKPDPSVEIVAQVITHIITLKPTKIIGFGGGSSIDTVKAAIYFSLQQNVIEDKPEFIAIPTTSGTGSEMTSFAVISDVKEKKKIALIHDSMYADMALLDPKLTLSVPPLITAHTGFDALTHALESYVAKKASFFTDGIDVKVVSLILENLILCYKNGKNLKAREAMSTAANMAGIAFNLAGLGVIHSIAHQLGGMFHIPHGLACAIALSIGIQFNCRQQETLNKYAEMSYQLGIAPRTVSLKHAVDLLCTLIKALRKEMEIESCIRELDLNIERNMYDEMISIMAKNASQDGCLTENPVSVSIPEFLELFKKLY